MAFDKSRYQSDKPKRIRKRKARTEVSSSSESSDTESSDSSSDSETEAKAVKKVVKKNKTKAAKKQDKIELHSDASSSTRSSEEPVSAAAQKQSSDDAKAEEAFTSFYLRQMTTEFAEDLDKIRSAGDFNNKSLGMLVDALKQGGSCFGKDERVSVGRSIVMRDS